MRATVISVAIVISVLTAALAGAQPTVSLVLQSDSLPAGTSPIAVATGDIDGDGNADLAVANSDSDDVSIFWGNGDGTFTPAGATIPVGTAAIETPVAIAIADVTGDGKPDIITANEFGNSVSVLPNQGSRGFGTAIESATGTQPEAVVVADLNGDSKLDVATPNLLDDTVTVLLGDNSGNFTMVSVCSNQQTQVCHTSNDCGGAACNPQPIPVDVEPDGLVAANLNGDSNLDLVVANSGGGPDATGSLTVLQGVGNGLFIAQPEITSATFDDPVFMTTADLNGDSKADLVVVNDNGDSLSVLLGNGDLSFQAATALNLSSFSMPEGAVVADFNNDGIPDIASSASLQDKVSVFLGQGNGNFAAPVDFGVPTDSVPFGLATADFNKDQKPDLAVADVTDPGTVSILLNASGVTLASAIGAGDTSLTLTDAGAFPTSGTILIDQEQISYTGKSGNTLTGLTRGVNGTTAAAHNAGTAVTQAPVTTPTPTPGVTPTPSGTPGAGCVGDCNGDNAVTVDEIVTMVNLALNGGTAGCSAGDGNHDGVITVDEIVTAVNNALNGCTA